MSVQSNPYLTPEEYLAIERKAEYKSGWRDVSGGPSRERLSMEKL